ncbi:MAG: lipocalin family protein [Pseudomonadota bacterium]
MVAPLKPTQRWAKRRATVARCAALLGVVLLASCVGTAYRDVSAPIVAKQDFIAEKYLGLWYEIARFPVIFERGCVATQAEYGAIDAETISVRNRCEKDQLGGPVRQIEGTAKIVAPGELKVRFDGVPFVAGDYWVLWVDDSYETAVVGVPSGKAGWILARQPMISPARRSAAEAVLSSAGYDVSQLYSVPQPEQ